MPSTTQTSQSSEATFTEGDTGVDRTQDDNKIFLGITTNRPPISNGAFSLDGGSQVTIYGSPTAKEKFLNDPIALSESREAYDEAQYESHAFASQPQQSGRSENISDVTQWNQLAQKLKADAETTIGKFNERANGSKVQVEVVENPTEDWKVKQGVSEVFPGDIDKRLLDYQRKGVFRNGEPSPQPSIDLNTKTGDLANGEE